MNSDEHRQAIELEIRNYGVVAARKDYSGLAGFFTEDAKVLPPGAPIVSGRKAIEEFWRAALEHIDVTFKTTELEVAGDMAYESGESDTGQAKGKVPCCLAQMPGWSVASASRHLEQHADELEPHGVSARYRRYSWSGNGPLSPSPA